MAGATLCRLARCFASKSGYFFFYGLGWSGRLPGGRDVRRQHALDSRCFARQCVVNELDDLVDGRHAGHLDLYDDRDGRVRQSAGNLAKPLAISGGPSGGFLLHFNRCVLADIPISDRLGGDGRSVSFHKLAG